MIDRATKYAEQVVIGNVVACKEHRQACERHLWDLERQGTKEFPYLWQPEKSERILEYAETLTIIEGEKPKPVKLYGNQCFDLGVPMGWIKQDGYRRFRRSYESMARQNGKTFKNGIRGTYFAGFNRYQYGKIFTAATMKRQSKLAWEEMAKFILADKDLSAYFKITEYKNLITALETHCTIEALSKEAGLQDGFRSIFNSIDEIHQHKDGSIYDALYKGTRSLPETLNSMITTRGKDVNTFCYEMDKYCCDILSGIATAEDFFVDIYTLDKDDDPYDPDVWIKANPVLCQTELGIETQRRDADTARDMGGSALSDYLVKCCNMWYQAPDHQYVSAEDMLACGCDETLEDYRGRRCVAGLDLSSGGDLTTLSLEFEDGEYLYYYSHSFMPRGRFSEHIKTDLAPYDVWEKQGLITVTGGEMDFKNDYMFIISKLKEILGYYDLKLEAIAADPHNLDGILSELEAFGVPVVAVTQTHRQLNDATVDIRLRVKSHKIKYDRRNELLRHSFCNSMVVENYYKEIKIDKQSGKRSKYRRIDPVDACIDCRKYSIERDKHTTVDTQKEMDNYLQQMGWK